MEIKNSSIEDIEQIFKFYQSATELQKSLGKVQWPVFDRVLVETEVVEKRQWKLIIEGEIACIWATTFDDPEIWGDKNTDPSVYIHRIATHSSFKGNNLVKEIVKWAIGYAKTNHKAYVRLDTIGGNQKLIDHYQNCGFDYLGLKKIEDSKNLPAHYHNATISLFEIKLSMNNE
jgi:hypothetical protein